MTPPKAKDGRETLQERLRFLRSVDSEELRHEAADALDAAEARIKELEADNARIKEAFGWLEDQARKSQTGISFDWVPSVEGERSGFRFMRRHFVSDQNSSLLNVITALSKPAHFLP